MEGIISSTFHLFLSHVYTSTFSLLLLVLCFIYLCIASLSTRRPETASGLVKAQLEY